jgi:integrase/recombinase XerD
LHGGGLRRAEAVALDVGDYDLATGALAIRHAKGHQQRVVYATNGSRAALDAWLVVRGDVAGALFLRDSPRAAPGGWATHALMREDG